MEAEDPPLLSESDDDSLRPSQVSLLWTKLHSLDTQLWRQQSAIEGVRLASVSQAEHIQALSSAIQDIRCELERLKFLLDNLHLRVDKCESALNLHSLD